MQKENKKVVPNTNLQVSEPLQNTHTPTDINSTSIPTCSSVSASNFCCSCLAMRLTMAEPVIENLCGKQHMSGNSYMMSLVLWLVHLFLFSAIFAQYFFFFVATSTFGFRFCGQQCLGIIHLMCKDNKLQPHWAAHKSKQPERQ